MNCLDLFCGCGGVSYGYENAGINVIAGIDIWDKAIESYSKNMPSHLALCKDLTKISPEHFEKEYNLMHKSIDIIHSSNPCQGVSMAGKRKTDDPRNMLFLEFVKYVEFYKPKVITMENVIGLMSAKQENGELLINTIMLILNEIGYNAKPFKLYASDFGVPQNRRRVIIIGFRKDLNINPIEPKVITHEKIPIRTILEPRQTVSIKQFLSKKAIDGINRKKEKSKQEGKGFGAQICDFDKPSYTISSRYWKDGSDCLIQYPEDNAIRRLTVLELKRIQTFPDDYILCGNKKDVVIQIGNAVPCLFAYHIGKHILNQLKIG